MPWEKSFNEENALAKAMVLFWEKGFKNTSMAELLKVTGLTRGSFYNAFGSKHQLFVKALLKYDIDTRRATLQQLAAMDAPVKSIKTFLDALISESVEDTEKKGCFLVNTSLEFNAHDKQVRQIVASALGEVETFFKQMIELGQLRNEIPDSVDPKTTAKAFLGTVVSIRVLGRGVFDKTALQAISEQTLSLIH